MPCGHSFDGFCVETFQATTVMVEGISLARCVGNPLSLSVKTVWQTTCWPWWRVNKYGAINFSPWTIEDDVRGCGELETECTQCYAAVKRENQKTHNDDYLMADTQSECRVLVKRKDKDKHRRNMCTLQGIICPLKCGEKVKTFLLSLHSALKKIWAWLSWHHFRKAHLLYHFCSMRTEMQLSFVRLFHPQGA